MRQQRLDSDLLQERHQGQRHHQIGDRRRQAHAEQERHDHRPKQHQEGAVGQHKDQDAAQPAGQVGGLKVCASGPMAINNSDNKATMTRPSSKAS